MGEREKIISYIGFALNARGAALGFDAVRRLKKKSYVLLLCRTASANAVRDAESLAAKHSCPLYVSKAYDLSEITGRENLKLIAVTDKSLGGAILAAAENSQVFTRGGAI